MPSRLPPGTYAIAITVVAVAIASVAAWRDRPTDAASRRSLGEAIGVTATAVRRPVAAAPASPGAPPDTAADAPAGGEPAFDRQGQVIPDLALRQSLDRYLSAQDAPSPLQRRQRLQRDLAAARMPAARSRQILDWFDRYAAYRQAEAAAPAPMAAAQRHALRERLLGPAAAAAFFADEAAAP
jgi:hypothetical protein